MSRAAGMEHEMAGISLQDGLRIPERVLFRRVDTEMAVINTDTGAYFGLDEVGTRMWELIAEHGLLHVVANRIREEFDVDPQRLEEDLLRLVDELLAHGLVERA